MAMDQRARLVGADAEALLLGRGEGLEQPGRGRTRSDMPSPRSTTSMATSPPLSKQRRLDRLAGGAGVDRVLDEVDERLLEPGRIGHGDQPGIAGRRGPDGRGCFAAATRLEQRLRPRPARGGSALARRAGREAGEQVVHLAAPSFAAWRSCRRGIRDCRRGARRCGRPG